MKQIQTLCAMTVLLILLGVTSTQAGELDGYGIYISDIPTLTGIVASAEAAIRQDPNNLNAKKRAGIATHQLAVFKGKGYAEKAIEYLEPVVEKNPNDVIALAYCGSSHAILAREVSIVFRKLSNVNKGISMLNKAVAMAPNNFIARMVRGSVFYELPSMFKKPKVAMEDFNFVVSRFNNLPDIGDADPVGLKGEVYYKLGQLKKNAGEKDVAAAYFQKAISAAPNTQWAKLAKKE